MKDESIEERSKRIIHQLKDKYPGKAAFDLDGRGMHFVCEVEPTSEHPEYDRAIEVLISSLPHKHLKMTQYYTILSGTLEFHIGEKTVLLHAGDKYTVRRGEVHWGKSDNECWLEIYSKPGWTKEDQVSI